MKCLEGVAFNFTLSVYNSPSTEKINLCAAIVVGCIPGLFVFVPSISSKEIKMAGGGGGGGLI